MKKKYGMPYKGSKSKIAEQILNVLPDAENFYDLFGGGCAVTHCALESGRYDNIICNDIEIGLTKMFQDAIHGKYKNEKRWISRDMFYELKDSDAFVRYIWSFGNNGRDYLYARNIESMKEKLFKIFTADTANEARLQWKSFLREYNSLDDEIKSGEKAEREQALERIERLQKLQSLESLERIERLQVLEQSYETVPIKSNSVIYCDIPYKGTNRYQKDFDYEKFYDWACAQESPVYISEYEMPEDRFECVFEIEHRSLICATANLGVKERIFVPKK